MVVSARASTRGITLGFRELGTFHEEPLAVRDRVDGYDVLVQQIDLLERETLCLWNTEVGKDDTTGTGRTPEVKHVGAKV